MARPKEFVEEEALDKAMHVFWQKGYYNTSVQDLVDGMSLCRASLYDTFGDKHALYLKTLHYSRALNTRKVTQAIEQATTGSGKIDAVFNWIIDGIMSDGDQKGCFLNNAALEMLPEHNQTVGQLVCNSFTSFETIFDEILRQGIASGEFRADLPLADTARFLVGITIGLHTLGKTRPDRSALDGIIRVALSALA